MSFASPSERLSIPISQVNVAVISSKLERAGFIRVKEEACGTELYSGASFATMLLAGIHITGSISSIALEVDGESTRISLNFKNVYILMTVLCLLVISGSLFQGSGSKSYISSLVMLGCFVGFFEFTKFVAKKRIEHLLKSK